MFEVVNPAIVGVFNIKYNESTAIDAAKKFWNELSKLIINELPKSFFTLKDEKNNLYHFKVTEERSGSGITDYMITQINNVDKKAEDALLEKFHKIRKNQEGGRRHRYRDDDSSSSSSSLSSSDDLIYRYNKIRYSRRRPIVYYHYIPNVYDDQSIFIPVFMYPIQPPYIEIGNISSALFNKVIVATPIV